MDCYDIYIKGNNMKTEQLRSIIREVIQEELPNMQHPDHEAKMARGELRDMVKLGAELYQMIQEGQELPGWVSGYITLASDYVHSVHQYMTENNN